MLYQFQTLSALLLNLRDLTSVLLTDLSALFLQIDSLPTKPFGHREDI